MDFIPLEARGDGYIFSVIVTTNRSNRSLNGQSLCKTYLVRLVPRVALGFLGLVICLENEISN